MHGRERGVLAVLRRCGIRDLATQRILEVGCGTGQWLSDLIKWGADPSSLIGIDLLEERIARARTLLPASVSLHAGSATQLPCEDESRDIVVQSTVFSSILDPATRRLLASEMLRVLKPGGIVLWYDFFVDNPKNPDVRGVRMREIRALFSPCEIDLRRATLAPPLTRALAPWSRLACEVLELVPLLRTHYLGALRKMRMP
jgi:ubiquinone/menaquinone biosynthesis C-methylase UbiE